ncbi:MAG: hypothetical protein B6245_15460 [Desulfobacteraceae bacterium 4572_88]|nr:MAG: hypothetical protein B6245_15460 [Desulfobacteraceae bacterium 4572_88]RLC00435.1 MAG: hypothetical protein DRI57_32315 [Deltaproteobacteria bacterium]
MLIKNNFNLSYDLSGNLILTIPKPYIQNIELRTLLKSVESLIRSETEKATPTAGWKGDLAADVAGICESGVGDGSVNHDRDIYGL